MRQVPITEVAAYLHRAKAVIAASHVVIASGQKNSATLATLGLRYQHQMEILLALTPQNYCGTHDAVDASRGEAWVFGVRERGMDIYIKFVIEERPDTHDLVLCLSFHEAEYPLRFPYATHSRWEGSAGG